MPRYLYKCDLCKELTPAMHSYKEKLADCAKCGADNSLRKLLTKPTFSKKHKTTKKAGDVTERFIEEAREELIIQKEDMGRER
jgi:putative FmdB family regulatory protein